MTTFDSIFGEKTNGFDTVKISPETRAHVNELTLLQAIYDSVELLDRRISQIEDNIKNAYTIASQNEIELERERADHELTRRELEVFLAQNLRLKRQVQELEVLLRSWEKG